MVSYVSKGRRHGAPDRNQWRPRLMDLGHPADRSQKDLIENLHVRRSAMKLNHSGSAVLGDFVAEFGGEVREFLFNFCAGEGFAVAGCENKRAQE